MFCDDLTRDVVSSLMRAQSLLVHIDHAPYTFANAIGKTN
nr:MAG TPA: hypothetical protein [Caudoviricetes sp.]